jgi:hypothetical protein
MYVCVQGVFPVRSRDAATGAIVSRLTVLGPDPANVYCASNPFVDLGVLTFYSMVGAAVPPTPFAKRHVVAAVVWYFPATESFSAYVMEQDDPAHPPIRVPVARPGVGSPTFTLYLYDGHAQQVRRLGCAGRCPPTHARKRTTPNPPPAPSPASPYPFLKTPGGGGRRLFCVGRAHLLFSPLPPPVCTNRCRAFCPVLCPNVASAQLPVDHRASAAPVRHEQPRPEPLH